MTTCFLAPDPIQSTQFIPGGNTPANGGQLFFYLAGSATKQTVFKDNAAATPWSNPIVLDSGGNLTAGGEVWFVGGETYRVVFAPSNDTDPPSSPYWSKDNLSGVNDISGSQSEWVLGSTPTFVSTTSFTVAGDQRSIFQVNRRVKTVNTGGTIYGTITAVAFTTLTTVTILPDSGLLDAGLSAVFFGIISATNTSEPGTHGSVMFNNSSAPTAGLTTTWTSPTALAWISGTGGGGGGGGRSLDAGAAGGGASGNVILKKQVSLTPQTLYTISLGAGGQAGTANLASTGANTLISSAAALIINIPGGAGGSSAAASTTALGGVAGTGGQSGETGLAGVTTAAAVFIGGQGGDTPWGGGGFGALAIYAGFPAMSAQSGQNGSGGGGGASANPGVGGSNGGAGGSGIIIIEW